MSLKVSLLSKVNLTLVMYAVFTPGKCGESSQVAGEGQQLSTLENGWRDVSASP